MPPMRARNVGVAVVAFLLGVAAVQVGTETYAVSPVAAQAPTIGPTNTPAARSYLHAAGTPGPFSAPAGSAGGSSAWPVIGVLILIAAVVAAGVVGTCVARRRSLGP
jgi:hypothetical protein